VLPPANIQHVNGSHLRIQTVPGSGGPHFFRCVGFISDSVVSRLMTSACRIMMGNLITAPSTGGVSVGYASPFVVDWNPKTNITTLQDPFKPTMITVAVHNFS